MIEFFYRWLPIVFCCHCRSDRSFHWKGRQFPICARCTGQLIGVLTGILIGIFGWFPVPVCLVLLLPLVVDGTIQMFSRYESNNPLRCLTGVLFGIGLYMLAARAAVFAVRLGYQIGAGWRESLFA